VTIRFSKASGRRFTPGPPTIDAVRLVVHLRRRVDEPPFIKIVSSDKVVSHVRCTPKRSSIAATWVGTAGLRLAFP
jgi:hypothetical protein